MEVLIITAAEEGFDSFSMYSEMKKLTPLFKIYDHLCKAMPSYYLVKMLRYFKQRSMPYPSRPTVTIRAGYIICVNKINSKAFQIPVLSSIDD